MERQPSTMGPTARATGPMSSLWIGQFIPSGRVLKDRGASASKAAATAGAVPVRTNWVVALTFPIHTGIPCLLKSSQTASTASRRAPTIAPIAPRMLSRSVSRQTPIKTSSASS